MTAQRASLLSIVAAAAENTTITPAVAVSTAVALASLTAVPSQLTAAAQTSAVAAVAAITGAAANNISSSTATLLVSSLSGAAAAATATTSGGATGGGGGAPASAPPDPALLLQVLNVVGALAGELASTAVNAPMVPAAVLSELKPYVSLVERLGRIAVQLVKGGVTDVRVVYHSARADDLDTRLLRAMVIKGLVEPVTDTVVNVVNADVVAKQRALRISEERVPADGTDVLASVAITLPGAQPLFSSARDGKGALVVEGSVRYGVPYLTRVGDFPVDISLEGSVLFCRQVDQPGMIGAVGSLLAKENVNISYMTVARIAGPRSTAVMAIGCDERPSNKVLEDIKAIKAIEEVLFLDLAA